MEAIETTANVIDTKPAKKGGLRGHAIFFSFWFTLGACVVCSHVYEWKIPVPGRSFDLPASAHVADHAATVAKDETASAL